MGLSDERLQTLLNYAYFYLKFRPRTKKEMVGYLDKKIKNGHWSKDDADLVIKQLEKEGLIDDQKFIDWFVRQRIALRPKGQLVLKQELLQKGVAKELIEDYFFRNPLGEEALALKTLKQRWPRFINLDKRKRFEKAISFLLRRGFSFELAKKTTKELIDKT